MSSTFTVNKSIEKPAHGDYNNDWDIPLNADMDDIDVALGGVVTISVTGLATGTYAFSLAQYRPPNIEFTGTIGAGVILSFFTPSGVGGLWSMANKTSGSGTIQVLSQGGGPGLIAIPQGTRVHVVCDGTTFEFAQTAGTSSNPSASVGLVAKNGTASTFMTSDSAPPLDVSINPTWTGIHSFNNLVILQQLSGANLVNTISGNPGSTIDMRFGTTFVATMTPGTADLHAASTAFVNTSFAPLASPVLSGVPVATTASVGTNTTQIATCAFTNPNSGSNANGRWREEPDGTWVMWGLAAGSAAAPGTLIPFPQNFPNACESVQISAYGSGTATILVYTDGGAHQTTTSGFYLVNGAGGNCYWVAYGH